METNTKTMLAAGGILAVALTIGSQIDGTKTPVMEPVAVEVAKAAKGAEIKSLREPNREVFKADSAWVHPKDARGAEIKADSFKVAAFTAKVYARPKYFMDADGDTLRPLDLTVREINALAKLNPLKTHDTYVDAGPYTARWMADAPGDFRMDAGGAYVKYRALFKGATTRTEATENGMKELVTLADSTAPKTLRWVVETDGTLAANAAGGFDIRAKDGTVPMWIQRPIAWDADNKPVMASATVEGDTLTFRVTVLPGQKYPVTVDPTTQVTSQVGLNGRVYMVDGTYLTARNSLAGYGSATSNISVGQSASFCVWRSFLGFPAIPTFETATACTLYLDGRTDASTSDFNIDIVGANAWKSVLTVDDFVNFDGWKSSGAYSGTILNNAWNSSSYSADWNAITFNAAGLDSLKAASGDSLWIALLSHEDYTASQPTDDEYHEFWYGTSPYISFTYTLPAPRVTNFVLSSPTTSTIYASWTNTNGTGIDSLAIYTGAGTYQKTLTDTATNTTMSGLSVNTQYIFKAGVDSGSVLTYSNADTLYTLANPPASWAFTEDYTDSTKITIGFDVNSNPAATEFAIRDSVAQKWVGADGVADEAARVWRTKAQWNTTASVINRDPTKLNRLGVVARNGDGIETAYIWGTVTTGNVRIVIANADSMWTHRAVSTNYTTAHDQTSAASIYTTAADTIGQNKRGADYLLWRMSLRYQLPPMDAALACTVFTTGSKDSSLTDFKVTARPGAWTDAQDITRRYWDFAIAGGLPNYINAWSTASYGATNHWIFNAAGIAYINYQYAFDGVMRFNFISDRDSAATTPSGAEYMVLTSPVIHLRYIKYDSAPTNIVATAISADSILVTWTDNTINESGFRLVNAYTGAALGGNDSTAAGATSKRYGGLSPNTKHNVAIQVIGGKLAGAVSAASDSCYTLANTPGAPTVTFPADSLGLIKLDVNGNPSYTEFAIQDSISGLYFDGRYNRWFSTTAAESVLWRTYAAWGGASGDTVAVGVGKKYRIRVKARSGK